MDDDDDFFYDDVSYISLYACTFHLSRLTLILLPCFPNLALNTQQDDDSQNGSADSGDVSIENEYYNSKGNIDDDVDEALAGFNRVVEMAPPQPDTAEWCVREKCRRATRVSVLSPRSAAMRASHPVSPCAVQGRGPSTACPAPSASFPPATGAQNIYSPLPLLVAL